MQENKKKTEVSDSVSRETIADNASTSGAAKAEGTTLEQKLLAAGGNKP